MFNGKSLILLLTFFVVCGSEPRKFYEENQNDEDDSVDCNDGLKIDDSLLLPFLKKLRGREMLPVRMKKWVILFDGGPSEELFEGWNKSFLTEWGLSKGNQSDPFGEVFTAGSTNVYLPRLEQNKNDTSEFRVMYAEQLLIDSIDKVKIVISFRPKSGRISESSTRLLKVLLKRARPESVTVISQSCPVSCVRNTGNPLATLASCGYIYGLKYKTICKKRVEPLPKWFFESMEATDFEKSDAPEFQVPLPVPIKKEFHSILDWLLKRIGQRMRNYMEMAFAKNRFRKTTADIYNKIDLQISKIKGGQTFEMARSAENIYKSLFDLNVYLNVTNTPFTFDKFHTFNLYLNYINQFSQGKLDTTKYANFLEPLKELCITQMSIGNSLMKKATKIFELEDGVYDLNGAICHENVLFIIDGMTTMNTIKSGIYDNENCKFDTVFVLAKKNFTINEDLSVPGKNVIIFAPTWIILREHFINLTGVPGKSDFVQAGQSGGDFYGFGVKFENSALLSIITNGGDGSDGREAPPSIINPGFVEGKDGKCRILNDKENEILEEYGASYGGPGGSPGKITVKILLGLPEDLTIVRNHGREGSTGKKSNLTFVCENGKDETLLVDEIANISVPAKEVERMSESEVLMLFRKVIRKNSKRLSYDVLNFYKDIWTSPLTNQTLDSILNDFLNSTDYSSDSKDFYEVTSQIIHSQIKRTCNMTNAQKTLVEFALVTINMKAPPEGVLPSEIDIDGFLENVENTIRKRNTEDEYFKKKDLKFRKIIEEATYYLRESLLPSLNQSMTETHQFLRRIAEAYQTNGNFSEGTKFQENLVANNILRYVTEIMSHIQVSLDDFVEKEELELSKGETYGDINKDKLEKKLYFFRNLRNNVTANEMKAMSEFLRLLRKTVFEGHESGKGSKCLKCEKVLRMVRVLENDLSEGLHTCNDCENVLNAIRKTRFKRSPDLLINCEQCNGDCRICPQCPHCGGITASQARSTDILCDECFDCIDCPNCPQCLDKFMPHDCSTCPCTLCPYCPLCRAVTASQARSTDIQCDECFDCIDCPNCPQCLDKFMPHDCSTCPCTLCPYCPLCRAVTASQARSTDILCDECFDCIDCPNCPQCLDKFMPHDCSTCPCTLCPYCPLCRAVTASQARSTNILCDACSDCRVCPFCENCTKRHFMGSCTSCRDCALCPDCPLCRSESECDNCENATCLECPKCIYCLRRFDEIEAGLFWRKNSMDSSSIGNAEKKSGSDLVEEFFPIDQIKKKRRSVGVKSKLFRFDLEANQDKTLDGQVEKILCISSRQNECSRTRNNFGEGTCEYCPIMIKIIRNVLDEIFRGIEEECNEKAEKMCFDVLNELEKIGARRNRINIETRNNLPIRVECDDCKDTLELFIKQLSSKINECEKGSSENYPKMESVCQTKEEHFSLVGCDPETYSRTYEDILGNFLNKFSHYLSVDPDHTGELDNVEKNFASLLTIVDSLLQEGLSPSDVPLGRILHVADNVVKFRDLKTEYEKKMAELYDFSETDMYDLFGSEVSMQNARLGMTSKWLNQLKKLHPWMKKVTRFLGANTQYQEVTERIIEAMRLVSEIVHNVKLLERHRELRDYVLRVKRIEEQEKTKGLGKALSDLQSNLRATFVMDVFSKAMTAAKGWVFPLTKSYQALEGIKNGTYHSRLETASKEIENYRKSIMLHTTIQNFENPKGETPFYEWRVGTRPTLVRDLLSGKPVILVSEILDGGRMNSLMAKDFEVNFFPRLRLAPGTKEKIDQTLKGFWINVTHSGISYFKFGSRIYRRLTETFTFRHTAGSVNRKKMGTQLDYVLSPYTIWILRMEPDAFGAYPYELIDQIGIIELVGKGRFIINCADIPDVNQYFIPLSDYGRRNEK